MNFNSVKTVISKALAGIDFSGDNSKTDSILTGSLTYQALMVLVDQDKHAQDRIPTLANEYAKTYANVAKGISKKYVSYKQIDDYIKNNEIENFMLIKERQVLDILSFYAFKQEIKPFSLSTYSQYMYNVVNITESDNVYLRNIHYKVIVPIAKYYLTYYAKKPEDIMVENIYSGQPGKGIRISISGIFSNKIYHDIATDSMGVMKNIYKLTLNSNNTLDIIIK